MTRSPADTLSSLQAQTGYTSIIWSGDGYEICVVFHLKGGPHLVFAHDDRIVYREPLAQLSPVLAAMVREAKRANRPPRGHSEERRCQYAKCEKRATLRVQIGKRPDWRVCDDHSGAIVRDYASSISRCDWDVRIERLSRKR